MDCSVSVLSKFTYSMKQFKRAHIFGLLCIFGIFLFLCSIQLRIFTNYIMFALELPSSPSPPICTTLGLFVLLSINISLAPL